MSRPRTIGIYEVVRRLEGQSREVYLARNPVETDRDFVLALFEVSEGDRLALEKEVKHCMRVDHPAVTRTVEAFAHAGKEVLVFESVVGASLHSLMGHLDREGERLSDGAILHIGRALVDALEASHGAVDERDKPLPLVHGQLSPYQVLIAWNGDVKLLGVGLSTIFRLAASNAQTPAEATPYQAPEVRRGGQVTTRANVYSAAALIWALLMGRTPPDDDGHLESLVQARPEIPRDLAKALDLALEPAITKRTMTCMQLAKVFASVSEACDREDLKWNMEVFRALIKVDEIMPTHSLPPSTLSQSPPESISVVPPDSLPPDSEPPLTPSSQPISSAPDSFEPYYDLPTGRHDFSTFKATAPSSRLSKRQGAQPTLIGTGATVPRPAAGKPDGEALDIDWDPSGDDDQEPSTRRQTDRQSDEPAASSEAGRTKGRGRPSLGQKGVTQKGPTPVGGPDTKRAQERPAPLGKGAAAKQGPSQAAQEGGNPVPPTRPSRPRGSQPGKAPPRPGHRLPPQKTGAAGERPKPTKPTKLPRPGRPSPAAAEDRKSAPGERTPSAPGVDSRPSAPGREPDLADRVSEAGPAAPVSDEIAEIRPSDPDVGVTPTSDLGTASPAAPADEVPPTPRSPTPAPPPQTARSDEPGEAATEQPPADRSAEPEPTPSPPAPSGAEAPTPAAPPAPAPAPARPDQVIHVDVAKLPGRLPPGAVGAPGVPLPPDGQWRLPIRWLVVVALTALASFVLGLLVSSGVEVSVSTGDGSSQPTAPPSPGDPSHPPGTLTAGPTPTAPAPPTPTATETPAPSAEPEAADAGKAPSADPATEVDPATLPPGRGYLVVESSQQDGEVYLKGVHAGSVGKANEVACGAGFVRLGTVPLTKWYGPGQAVTVACQSITRVTLEPGRNPPVGPTPTGKVPTQPRSGTDWVPSTL